MQYLAEVKKTQAFVGLKVEVKLLARNTSENNWQAINNDESIAIVDTSQARELKDGQLVLADINNNKQVQSLQDASKRIVLILQNFSRLQDKFKQGEEDIEQWKQSLNYQSQELHRREMELEQKEQEFEQIEVKRQEAETGLEELKKEREEFEKWRQELQHEQTRLTTHATTLDREKAIYLQDLAQRISTCISNPSDLRQHIGISLDVIHHRQEAIAKFWGDLEIQRSQAIQQQGALSKAAQDLNNRKIQWQQTQSTLADTQAELKAQTGILKVQENNAAMIRVQLEAQVELFQQTSQVIESYGISATTLELLDPEEVKRLEEMSIQDLEAAVTTWQLDFDKMSNFVGAQEDELAGLEGELADLQSQIDQAGDFDRIQLESDKEFAEEQYKMLEDALSGQRRVLQEKLSVVNQQKLVLERRQGIATENDNPAQNLLPLLAQIESQKSKQEKELQKIESQIEAVRGIVQQQQELVSRQSSEQQQQQQEIQALEEELKEKIRITSELTGQIGVEEQILRPVQDIVDTLRQHLEAALAELDRGGETQNQQQLATELHQAINSLIPEPA